MRRGWQLFGQRQILWLLSTSLQQIGNLKLFLDPMQSKLMSIDSTLNVNHLMGLQKKGGNVKTIPPYKPVNHGVESSDPSSSPEKDTEAAALIPIVNILGINLKISLFTSEHKTFLNDFFLLHVFHQYFSQQ